MRAAAETVPQPASTETSAKALVVIRGGGSKPPLFCVHAEAGHLRLYDNLARHLAHDRPLYGLRGVVSDDPPYAPYRQFEQMARRYAREIRELQPIGPYFVLGECDGGELAYEIAQQLRMLGQDLALLALVDSFGPGGPRLRRFAPKALYRLVDSMRMVGFHLRTVARLNPSSTRRYLTTRLSRVLARITMRWLALRGERSAEFSTQEAFRAAHRCYQASPYAGRVVLFRGAQLPWGIEPAHHLGWGDVASDLETAELPAYFGTTMLEPAVRELAQKLEHAMDVSTVERASE
jgi:thioesterase domain-containing protein